MKEEVEIAKLKAKQEESRRLEMEQELDRIKAELKKVSQNMKKNQDLDDENKKLRLKKESNIKPLFEEDEEMEPVRLEEVEEEIAKERKLAAEERKKAARITEKKQRSLLAARLEMEKYLKEVAIEVELQNFTRKADILKEMNQRSLLQSRLRLDAQEIEATTLNKRSGSSTGKEREKTRETVDNKAIQNETANESNKADQVEVSVADDGWETFYVKELE